MMWKTFSIDSDVYLLKIINNDGIYKICLSDLEKFWSEDYSKNELVRKFKGCNPIIVVEDEEAVSQTIKILHEISNATVTLKRVDGNINLEIKSAALAADLAETKFRVKYELNLILEDQSKYTEEVTVPMLHTINYLEKQQKLLCDLLKKKDRELEEYKMEKGLISRTDLITEKFNSDELENSNETLLLNVCSKSEKFWDCFINKYGDVDVNVLSVNVDPWNQVKRKRKMYNAKTSAKKFVSGISYKRD